MSSKISVTRYPDTISFIQAVEAPLSATREWQNNLPIGIYNSYNSPTPPPQLPGGRSDDFVLLSTHDESGLCLVATKSPSWHSISVFSAVDIDSLDVGAHVGAIVAEIRDEQDWASFGGDARLVDALARGLAPGKAIYEQRTIYGSAVTSETLAAKVKNGLPKGHGIKQVRFPEDEVWLRTLAVALREFHIEANNHELPIEYCLESVVGMVSRGDVWVYVIGDEPVAGCYLGRPTARGKNISHVETRPQHRRKGYAEALVGEVCRKLLLEEGLGYLMLFYEGGGIASRIYKRIGFGTGGGETEITQRDIRMK